MEFGWSVCLAIVIGLAFASRANHDAFHAFMRLMRLTNRRSHPSEWYGTFTGRGRFVVLHLDGERRPRGWPTSWPDQPDKGHLVIHYPAWILDDESVSPIYEDDRILVPAADVKMVEFLKCSEEITEDPEVIIKSRRLLTNAQKKVEEKEDGSQGAAKSP